MTGKEKIAILIAEKGQKLIQQLVPSIIDITAKTGIENIGTPNIKFPDFCLPQNELKKIVNLRNNLLSKINSTAKSVENLSKVIDPLNKVVTVNSTAVNTLKGTITGLEIAIPFLPTAPPGTPSPAFAALNTKSILEKTVDITTPKIGIAKNAITSISTSLDFTNNIFSTLVNLLKSIDKYLEGCGVATSDLNPFNNYLTNVEAAVNQTQAITDDNGIGGTDNGQTPSIPNSIYNGFILEIVEVPFSPTVKQIKAVAKNPNGIILLQTPLSFTTTPQVLIEELKLIIDSSDLKVF